MRWKLEEHFIWVSWCQKIKRFTHLRCFQCPSVTVFHHYRRCPLHRRLVHFQNQSIPLSVGGNNGGPTAPRTPFSFFRSRNEQTRWANKHSLKTILVNKETHNDSTELEGHGFVADSAGFPTSISSKLINVRTRFFCCREFVQKQRRFLRETQNRWKREAIARENQRKCSEGERKMKYSVRWWKLHGTRRRWHVTHDRRRC